MSLPRTQEALEALEEAICRNYGDLNAAANVLGTPARYIHMWSLSDPEVAERIRQAQMIGWAGLESVLYQRAVVGVEKDIYFKGAKVGTETVTSDALLALMAKARIPGYGETAHLHTHMVNVRLMPRASSYEEWNQQRELALQNDGAVIDQEPRLLEDTGSQDPSGVQTYHTRNEPGSPAALPASASGGWAAGQLRDVL